MYIIKGVSYNSDYNEGGDMIYRIILMLLTAATFFDLRTGKIPNLLSGIGILTGYAYHIYTEGICGTVICTVRMLIPVALLFLLFLIHALGAGDIKLFSAIASMAEPSVFFHTLLYSFLVGALYALFKLCYHRNLISSFKNFGQYLGKVMIAKKCIPYRKEVVWDKQSMHFSVAIFAGYLLSMGVVY